MLSEQLYEDNNSLCVDVDTVGLNRTSLICLPPCVKGVGAYVRITEGDANLILVEGLAFYERPRI